MLCYSKLIGLRAKLQDAAGAVRSHNLYNFHKYFLYIIICRKRSRWKNVSLLEIPIRKQDYTSLCRAQGKTACSFDNATFRVVLFVLGHVISVSTYQNFLEVVFFQDAFYRNWVDKADDWSRKYQQSGQKCFWRQQSGDISWFCVLSGKILSQITDCLFVQTFSQLLSKSGCFWLSQLSKVCDKSKTWVGFLPSSAVCI